MHQTVEAVYHDGIVEFKEKPAGIRKAKVLVTFLDSEEPEEKHKIDWARVKQSKSSFDKWIGVIEGADIGDWKADRRKYLEDKHS